jgi:hypothetical protein
MGKFTRDELESAFQRYWQAHADEDWDALADSFTRDGEVIEYVLGSQNGREQIRDWVKSMMDATPELYVVYQWHLVDEERDDIVVYVQYRRDHPAGTGTIDYPGISVLHYAGDGLFDRSEDFWPEQGEEGALTTYLEACAVHDPDHRRKRTRANWGDGPDWSRGAATWLDRKGAS